MGSDHRCLALELRRRKVKPMVDTSTIPFIGWVFISILVTPAILTLLSLCIVMLTLVLLFIVTPAVSLFTPARYRE